MRLINADALKEEITKYFNDVMDINEIKTVNTVIMLIDNAPTFDITKNQAYDKGFITAMKLYSRPQGEWKLNGMIWYCSNCGKDCEQGGNNFCGNCGADMRGDKDGK